MALTDDIRALRAALRDLEQRRDGHLFAAQEAKRRIAGHLGEIAEALDQPITTYAEAELAIREEEVRVQAEAVRVQAEIDALIEEQRGFE